jgi:hypothetical protein
MLYHSRTSSARVLTKIYPPLPTSVQPISITKTLLIVPTKNERNPPLFTGKLLIKFQNILRNTTNYVNVVGRNILLQCTVEVIIHFFLTQTKYAVKSVFSDHNSWFH